jgi:peptidoglycan/LPS O-acetylase OafA/YrhL
MEPWFDREILRYLVVAIALGFALPGALLQVWAERGQNKVVSIAISIAGSVMGALALMAAVIASIQGQPDYVVTLLFVSGVVILAAYLGTIPSTLKMYGKSEMNRSLAKDL